MIDIYRKKFAMYSQMGSGSRLPSGYTEVEYIENTSNAYIDTLYLPNQNTSCEFSYLAKKTTQEIAIPLGCTDAPDVHNANNGLLRMITINNNVDYNRMGWGISPYSIISKFTINPFNERVYNKWDKADMYINDTFIGKSQSKPTWQASKSIWLFARNGGSPFPFIGYIYDCKLWNNEQLVRDFIPCINPQNEVGLYDMVEQKFYKSPNGTPFIAGNPI